jgi:hypothetical protein
LKRTERLQWELMRWVDLDTVQPKCINFIFSDAEQKLEFALYAVDP